MKEFLCLLNVVLEEGKPKHLYGRGLAETEFDTAALGQCCTKITQVLPNLIATRSSQAQKHSSEVWLHILCIFPPAGHGRS